MTKKLKNYLKTGTLLFGITLLLWNCESENADSPEGQQSNIETVAANEAIDFFTVKTASNLTKTADKTYAIPHLDYIVQEEISNNDALLTVIPATTIHSAHYSRILLLKINNKIQSIVFSMYPSDGSTHEHFSGEIIITDISGNFLNGYRVVNGIFVSQLRKTATAGKTAVAAKNNNVVCPDHGECVEGSNCIVCLQELEEVVVTGNSGNNGGPTPFVDLNDFPGIEEGGGDGPDMGMGWDYGPGEGGSPDDNNAEEDITIDPEFSEDYPCQAAIVQEVYSNCAPLSQLFQDIFEGNDTFNVTFKAEELNEFGLAADTDGELPNNYTIKLNTLRLEQSTELDIINTATHEYVHAIMFHYFYQGHFQLTGAENPPTYAELAEGFAKHRAGFEGDHHPYMTSLAHNIADVTYAWATDNGYTPGDFTDYDTNPADAIDGLKEFLRQLAWNGLTNTTTFKDLYPQDSPDELQIKKIIQDEAFPNDGGATPKGNPPVPCN